MCPFLHMKNLFAGSINMDNDVQKLVKSRFSKQKIRPGEDIIPASGKVMSAADIEALIEAALNVDITEGTLSKEFEHAVCLFLKRQLRYALMTNSGSSANLLAVTALMNPKLGDRALKRGDEVITAAVGFPTTVAPIVQNGLVPVFVDVDLATYVPRAADVEGAITDDTKAIVLAHTLGNAYEVEAIQEIAKEYGLYLIEDICDAFGTKYHGDYVGSFGDLATVSLYPAHMMTVGEGGLVLCQSPIFYRILDSLRSWGRDCWCEPGKDNTCGKRFGWKGFGELPNCYDHKYVYSNIGYNLKSTDLQAALGLSQIKRLEEFNEQRKVNWKHLRSCLADLKDYFVLPKATRGADPVWFGFALTLVKNAPFTRTEIIQYLENDKKIGTRLLFGGNLLRQPGFIDIPHRVSETLDMSNVVTEDTFWVGCWHGLNEKHMDYISDAIHFFVSQKVHGKKYIKR